MRQRRETVEHPFATLKMRIGATHFLMKRLPKVATEMALHVLTYNLTRVIGIMGIQPLIAAMTVPREVSSSTVDLPSEEASNDGDRFNLGLPAAPLPQAFLHREG
jgi:hypothetical protein